jgi:hypothetical protein
MENKKLTASQVDYLFRRGQRASNNAFLWSIVHNVTGLSGCVAPFVLSGMYGKLIPRNKVLILGLLLAWPINYFTNANQRALWSSLDYSHFMYRSEFMRLTDSGLYYMK